MRGDGRSGRQPGPRGTTNVASGCDTMRGDRETRPMGLNPFRPEDHSIGDYVMAAVAVLACLAAVAWAVFG